MSSTTKKKENRTWKALVILKVYAIIPVQFRVHRFFLYAWYRSNGPARFNSKIPIVANEVKILYLESSCYIEVFKAYLLPKEKIPGVIKIINII